MNKKKKIAFLNPPGDKIYIRDYYCSKVSKAYYLPQPVDLLIQTAYFDTEKYTLKVIDAIAEKKDTDTVLKQIAEFEPDLIVGTLGSVSLSSDVHFYETLKKSLPNTKIACSGDALLEKLHEKLTDYKWLDLIITNFYSDGAKAWFEDKPAFGVAYIKEGKLINEGAKKGKQIEMPVPKQKLFKGNYRMPFANAKPIATVLTNYACPYPCTFCIMSTLQTV